MTVRVKRPFCVGLDVHKNNVWASVIIHSPDKPKAFHATRKFASNHHCLMELVNWIKSFQTAAAAPCDEIHVYMESTGKYSTPVYNVLEECGLIPHLVNPKNVRTISGQKTDQKDCEWIAELGSFGLLMDSYIPERAIRDARAISRRRTKLVQQRADEHRRIRNVLTEANVRIDLIFSEVDGQSSRAVIQHLLDHEDPDLESVRACINPRCNIVTYHSDEERKEKGEALHRSYSGAKFSSSQKFVLRSSFSQLDKLSTEIEEHKSMMEEILAPYKDKLELLETIPGISELSAMQILCEIGPDMKHFKSCKHFISWAGLCPASNQSNNKHKSVKIGKGGTYLKPILIQCALNAYKYNPYYGRKFQSISKRRGKKRALIAIARKMMVAAYHILLTGEPFNPKDQEPNPTPSRTEQDTYKQLNTALFKSDNPSDDNVILALEVLTKAGVSIDQINNLKLGLGVAQI